MIRIYNFFFSFRIKQLFRLLISLGIVRFVLVSVVLVFVMFVIFRQSSSLEMYQYIVSAIVVLLGLNRFSRNDILFLKTAFDKYQMIIIAEYFIFSLPVIITGLFYGHLIVVLFLLASILLIPFISYKFSVSNVKVPGLDFFSPLDFEWKSGIRERIFFLFFIYFFGVIFSFLPGVIMVAIFFLGIIISAFYYNGESLEILVSYEMSSVQFLKFKIFRLVKLYTVCLLPFLITAFIFNSYVVLIVAALMMIFLIYILILKYAFYVPGQDLSGHGIYSAIGLISLVIPFMIPILWMLTYRFYRQAIRNLNLYLYDFD